MIKTVVPFVHSILDERLQKDHITIDATIGNGNDTLFLAQRTQKVYGFDVQENALTQTENLLSQHELTNYELILDSHEFISNHISEPIDCAMFNLGYLPGDNKHITTTPGSTIKALEACITLLNKKGIITVTVYTGHDEGKVESEVLLQYVTTLSSRNFTVLKYEFINKNNSPYVLLIEKIKN